MGAARNQRSSAGGRMTRRVEAGPVLVTLGALLLLASLFLDWYEPGISAWEAFEVWDIVLLVLAAVCIVAGIGLAVPGPRRRGPPLAAVDRGGGHVDRGLADPRPAARRRGAGPRAGRDPRARRRAGDDRRRPAHLQPRRRGLHDGAARPAPARRGRGRPWARRPADGRQRGRCRPPEADEEPARRSAAAPSACSPARARAAEETADEPATVASETGATEPMPPAEGNEAAGREEEELMTHRA